jgi:two-component system, NtrC family, sensor kinase
MSPIPHQQRCFSSRHTIRKKLLIGAIVLGIVVAVLGYSGFRGVYAYRDLVTTLSHRANEFPITSQLIDHVDDMRFSFREIFDEHNVTPEVFHTTDHWGELTRYRDALRNARDTLSRYQTRLQSNANDNPYFADIALEKAKVASIDKLLDDISDRFNGDGTPLEGTEAAIQREDLSTLNDMVHELPTLLHNRIASARDEVRTRYRIWIVMTWLSFAIAACLLMGLIAYARLAVIRPFKKLLDGARQVASGKFNHIIEIDSEDEIAELAFVINQGTGKFLDIQSTLNQEVLERSQEVIRNEQLASVGFLAAGVAHEINNPLASIAWSAEALESRLHKILHPIAEQTGVELPELDTLKTYLRRIQDEAFRCKGITERLLDFSRLSQAERKQETDLVEVVQDVIELVRHLGQYRHSRINFIQTDAAIAWASPQEMKQVVLNLLTNALDALTPEQPDQEISVTIKHDQQWVYLSIEDNGCGMTDEVRTHLFEPFFTRRRDGRGTGLGLPITSRIIADHGGRIVASSRGVNLGSKFEVLIPTFSSRVQHDAVQSTQYVAVAA